MSSEDDIRQAMNDARYDQEWDDTLNYLLMLGLGILVVGAAIVFGSEWIDAHTGWHLHGFITDHIPFLKDKK